MNKANFENACREIGQALGLGGINDDKVDLKALVKTALETSSTKWLLVIDNADEVDLLFDGDKVALREFLPVNRLGSILFTTRSREVTMKLDILPRNIHRVAEMSEHEAISMLRNNIGEERVNEATESSKSLVNLLACLPLAVKQASAFIAQNGIPISRYLEHFRRSDKDQIKLLSRNFEDQNRYHDIDNPIATTWLSTYIFTNVTNNPRPQTWSLIVALRVWFSSLFSSQEKSLISIS